MALCCRSWVFAAASDRRCRSLRHRPESEPACDCTAVAADPAVRSWSRYAAGSAARACPGARASEWSPDCCNHALILPGSRRYDYSFHDAPSTLTRHAIRPQVTGARRSERTADSAPPDDSPRWFISARRAAGPARPVRVADSPRASPRGTPRMAGVARRICSVGIVSTGCRGVLICARPTVFARRPRARVRRTPRPRVSSSCE